jgi:hypothetical protein
MNRLRLVDATPRWPVHDEAVRCVEKPTPITDRKSGRILNKSTEKDFFFEELSQSLPTKD